MVGGQVLVIALVIFGVGQSSGESLIGADLTVVDSRDMASDVCPASAGAGDRDLSVGPLTSAGVLLARESSGALLLLFLAICGVSTIAWKHVDRQ